MSFNIDDVFVEFSRALLARIAHTRTLPAPEALGTMYSDNRAHLRWRFPPVYRWLCDYLRAPIQDHFRYLCTVKAIHSGALPSLGIQLTPKQSHPLNGFAQHSVLENCVARPSQSDIIIDLAIALESTILRGIGQELSYRLALRAAYLLREQYSPAKIFSRLKWLYNKRSKIVHDGEQIHWKSHQRHIRASRILTHRILRELMKRMESGQTLRTILDNVDSDILARN